MKMTKQDIKLHERVAKTETNVETILNNHLPHLQENIDDTRKELKQDIDNVKNELKEDIRNIKTEFINQLKKLDWKFAIIAIALILLVIDHADALIDFIKMLL